MESELIRSFSNLSIYESKSSEAELAKLRKFYMDRRHSGDPAERLMGYATMVLYDHDDDHSSIHPDNMVDGSTFGACWQVSEIIHRDITGTSSSLYHLVSLSGANRPPGSKNNANVMISKILYGTIPIGYLCIASVYDNSLFCLIDEELDTIFYSYIEDGQHHFAIGGKMDVQIGDGYEASPIKYDPSDVKKSLRAACINHMNAFGGANTRAQLH
jgi:hypothetical protein